VGRARLDCRQQGALARRIGPQRREVPLLVDGGDQRAGGGGACTDARIAARAQGLDAMAQRFALRVGGERAGCGNHRNEQSGRAPSQRNLNCVRRNDAVTETAYVPCNRARSAQAEPTMYHRPLSRTHCRDSLHANCC